MFGRPKAIDVLYVEDDESDVDLARIALTYAGEAENFKMAVVHDGDEALKYLQRQGPYQNAARPDMVLLDLNLPKMHGKEVLRQIKNMGEFKRIPVVVLTTSKAQMDIDESYALGASAYITKPDNFESFKEAFRLIYAFWTTIAHFPSKQTLSN